jgi:hypothetical protein
VTPRPSSEERPLLDPDENLWDEIVALIAEHPRLTAAEVVRALLAAGVRPRYWVH